MGSGKDTTKSITCKFPKSAASTVLLGDSQTKYLYQYFDPLVDGTPAFVSQSGAMINDVCSLLDFVPQSAETIILHVGTNDLTSCSGRIAFERYKDLLGLIARTRPNIRRIYASLILPRSNNRRRGNWNQPLVHHCNKEAGHLNHLLRRFCQRSRLVFYLDHQFEWLPPNRVLAADGLHPSFEGVSVLACHIRQLCFRKPKDMASFMWTDYAPSVLPCRTSAATGPTRRAPSTVLHPRRTAAAAAKPSSLSSVKAPLDRNTSTDHLPQPAVPYEPAPTSTNGKTTTPQPRYNLRGHRSAPSNGTN
ncbi:hypothetical protein HPB50_029021 [Hyalomma asiaticum]|nr:hypothetical protein HPB50_029021 [Hyalomma asiaticum]